jgi:uncharacterized protein YndB with AHSA1/START domain
MVDILHRAGFENTAPEQVYEALNTLEGICGWWVEDTTGTTDANGVTEFQLPGDSFHMNVTEREPGRHLLWEVDAGAPEWIGTKIHWDLKRDGDWTILLFKHEGWREPVEFMHHCSTKWASFLMSLKEYVETGTGRPGPRDVKTDNW